MPFIAVAEAHVLRSLRSLGLRMSEIREAAAAVRDAFDTPYGLVSMRIATDGVDIFVEHGWGDLRRARDGQVQRLVDLGHHRPRPPGTALPGGGPNPPLD